MIPDFLKEFSDDADHEARPRPLPRGFFNPYGDCLEFQVADEAVVAERISAILTIYRSAIDNRAIGFQVKGVTALAKKLGFDRVDVDTEVEDDGDTKRLMRIRVMPMLLGAFKADEADDPKSFEGYSDALRVATEAEIMAGC